MSNERKRYTTKSGAGTKRPRQRNQQTMLGLPGVTEQVRNFTERKPSSAKAYEPIRYKQQWDVFTEQHLERLRERELHRVHCQTWDQYYDLLRWHTITRDRYCELCQTNKRIVAMDEFDDGVVVVTRRCKCDE